MTIDVELAGRRYLEDRYTAAIVSGSQSRATKFTERWTLALDGPDEQPRRITAVRARRATLDASPQSPPRRRLPATDQCINLP